MNVVNIIKKIIKNDNFSYQRMKYEDSDGFYNVWKIEFDNKFYILKQVKNKELNFYNNILSDYIPKIYGNCSYYNKQYILIEYINGNNLMKCERKALEKTLNAIINIQNTYLNYNNELISNYEEVFKNVINRKQYLKDEKLEKTYDMFINRYQNIKKTLIHKDLLPFNVIVNEDKAVLIDWGYYGILPYPLMLCRLIAHCKNDINYLFYMNDEDKIFAIEYYYSHFISSLGIDYNTYLDDINYFMFYEYTEWVFVYNKYNKEKDDMFNYYYNKANEYALKIKR